jgi:hypothetical protein
MNDEETLYLLLKLSHRKTTFDSPFAGKWHKLIEDMLKL